MGCGFSNCMTAMTLYVLSIEDTDCFVIIPFCIQSIKEWTNVVFISGGCAYFHAILIDEENDLYGFGDNVYRQTGSTVFSNMVNPAWKYISYFFISKPYFAKYEIFFKYMGNFWLYPYSGIGNVIEDWWEVFPYAYKIGALPWEVRKLSCWFIFVAQLKQIWLNTISEREHLTVYWISVAVWLHYNNEIANGYILLDSSLAKYQFSMKEI